MISIERIEATECVKSSLSNFLPQHPAENAAWIGPADPSPDQPLLLEFSRNLILKKRETILFHLSADQRFQLRINGSWVAAGPDRSDLAHWSVASYRATLPQGRVNVSILVWWLPPHLAPLAQVTHRPALILAAEGTFHNRLSTGQAPWKMANLSSSLTCQQSHLPGFHVIGPHFGFTMDRWERSGRTEQPAVLRSPLQREYWGSRSDGWRLFPTPLPEQNRQAIQPGTIRLVRKPSSRALNTPAEAPFHDLQNRLQALLKIQKSVRIPSGTSIEIFWDLGKYYCGYPDIKISGGRGTRLEMEWAESLYEAKSSGEVDEHTAKGNRGKINNKSWLGFGDHWVTDGKKRQLPSLWWRSGRYLRIRIQTKSAPLTLNHLGIVTTGYPFTWTGTFDCDDSGLLKAWPLLRASLEHCAHEQWVDCPYYEQLSYVGDNNTELSSFCLDRSESITRRCLQLFDWSRLEDSGFVAERYPSFVRQDSFTYTLLYPRLVHDYAMWRDDPETVRELLPGLRSLLELCLEQLHPDGRLHRVPGWPFIDWVAEWEQSDRAGCPQSAWEGDSSLVNLHLLLALQDYARIEQFFGDATLARRATKTSRELTTAIKARYWNPKRLLLADDGKHTEFSEHAQAWAILSGILNRREQRRCLQAWEAARKKKTLSTLSIYFSHYALDAYYQLKAPDLFFDRLSFWKQLPKWGLTTAPERPEPSRSDCHGWGAHPIYHSFASIAGIRPVSAGFRKLLIAPMPGPLKKIDCVLPHPAGDLEMNWSSDEAGMTQARIRIPRGVSGEYRYGRTRRLLKPGVNRIEM